LWLCHAQTRADGLAEKGLMVCEERSVRSGRQDRAGSITSQRSTKHEGPATRKARQRSR